VTSVLRHLSERFTANIDREIKGWLSFEEGEPSMRNMLRYQLGYVDQDLQPGPGGGKRFRPILCLLAAEAVSGEWTNVLPLAAAIELVHNFSLIHDDIEDQDAFRRHRPTVWKVWGEAQAINAGDGMFALAGRAALAAGDSLSTLEIARRFQDTVLKLTEGQFLDLRFETATDVAIDTYLRMIELKTSALIAFSVWSGATAAGAGDEPRAALNCFGRDLGLAFQIHDDIMGIWGTPQETGKEPHTDLLNRKKTLPVLIAFERAGSEQHAILSDFYSRRNDDVSAVLQVLQETGARQEAEVAVNRHRSAASRQLDRAELSPAATQTFSELTKELTG